MKILVCGSRFWNNIEVIANFLSGLVDEQDVTIIHGACRGADFIAGECAKQLNFLVREYPADWIKYKKLGNVKLAGIMRNQQMIDIEHDEDDPIKLCVAFHDDVYNKSTGTLDMIARCEKYGIPVRIITQNDN
jgi:hypothetical protein